MMEKILPTILVDGCVGSQSHVLIFSSDRAKGCRIELMRAVIGWIQRPSFVGTQVIKWKGSPIKRGHNGKKYARRRKKVMSAIVG